MNHFIEEKNRIYMEDEKGRVIAEITYPDVDEDTVNINHTFVDDSLRGQGIAGQLVEAAAVKAEKENKKIIPTCSYAIHWFEKHQEYASLLK